MNDQLKTSCRLNYEASHSVTSSPALESGATPCAVLDGPTTVQSGPAVARANLSARPENAEEQKTSGTYGPSGSGSSTPADLPSSSENKCPPQTLLGWRERARLKNLEYQKTYRLKHRAQCLITRVKSRAKKANLPFDLDEHVQDIQARIDVNKCEVTGFPFNLEEGLTWDSPLLGTWGEQRLMELAQAMSQQRRKRSDDLSRKLTERLKEKTARLGSTLFRLTWKQRDTPLGVSISVLRALVLRTSGKDCTSAGVGTRQTDKTLAPWITPQAKDWRSGQAERYLEGKHSVSLNDQVTLVSGRRMMKSGASMEGRGQLNPAHSRWLQGLPTAWENCADMVTRSVRRSRKASSKPTSKSSKKSS